MIWFGNLNRILTDRHPDAFGPEPERARMQHALERVAEQAPHLTGGDLLAALAETGWVDRATAERLLPTFRHFDPDRHFSEHLRRLSFRGRGAASEFRSGVRHIVQELTGSATVRPFGPDEGILFRRGDLEGVVFAHPEVSFSIGGPVRDAIAAAAEEMPDSLVVVARNFEPSAAAQLASLLHRTEVPGTLVTVNLLLGIRAVTLRYQPPAERVVRLLGAGRPLRSADVARLGDRS
jgi:hypothetical protein